MNRENLLSLDVPPWRYIISTAMRSPSGDNCQPWFFEVEGLNLKITISKDLSSHFMNQSGFADWISLGCVIESIYILCSPLSWSFELQILSDTEIVLRFFKAQKLDLIITEKDLISRATYRGEFLAGSLEDEKKLQKVLNDFLDYSSLRFPQIKFYYKSTSPDKLLKKLNTIDTILWFQPQMIIDFLTWLRFTKIDWGLKKDGFFRSEVDVKIIDVPILFLAKKFSFLVNLLKIVFPQIVKLKITKWNKNILARVYISSHEESMVGLIDLGRAALALWTICNKAEFAVQPLTMSTLTAGEIAGKHYDKLLKSEVTKTFSEYFQEFKAELGTKDNIIWGFRVGLVKEKNLVRSLRRDLAKQFQEKK